ncbi:MAG TPA: FmdB family zinc ribbon protein [Egibacteraceae bacterium]
MPTYEYACRDCGEHVEVVQSFKDAPLTTCGVCGGPLRKVFSAAGIIFKGSGYYVTDTRKASSKSDSSSSSDSGSSSDSSSSTPAAESA